MVARHYSSFYVLVLHILYYGLLTLALNLIIITIIITIDSQCRVGAKLKVLLIKYLKHHLIAT